MIGYGTGAVFGCPAHDKRDFEFAKKYDFKILSVIEPPSDNKKNLPYIDKILTSQPSMPTRIIHE